MAASPHATSCVADRTIDTLLAKKAKLAITPERLESRGVFRGLNDLPQPSLGNTAVEVALGVTGIQADHLVKIADCSLVLS